MAVLLTPGVYRRPRREALAAVRLVRTDVVGFAGVTERGPFPEDFPGRPRDAVLRLTSWSEFQATYGGYIAEGFLAFGVRAFFENGGEVCHVIRIAATQAPEFDDRPRAAVQVADGDFGEPIVVQLQADERLGYYGIHAVKPGGKLGEVVKLPSEQLARLKGQGFERMVLVRSVSEGLVKFASAVPSSLAAPGTLELARVEHPRLVFRARSAGSWGNRIRFRTTLQADERTFSLHVVLEAPDPRAKPVAEEFYRLLSLDKENAFYVEKHLNQTSNLILAEVNPGAAGTARHMPQRWTKLELGSDGLAKLSVPDFTGGTEDLRGLRLLEEVDEVSILCVPDSVFPQPLEHKAAQVFVSPCDPPVVTEPKKPERPGLILEDSARIQNAMLDQCERNRDRVAILDVPLEVPAKQDPIEFMLDWRARFHSTFGALYAPWLRLPKGLPHLPEEVYVPPSGHIAGIYAQNDLTRGVHHPPGNLPIEFADNVADEITAEQQEQLNPGGVCAIRSFAGRGLRVWGVRSLASAQQLDWRFIHVRRLISMIEESIDKSMQWTAFEPNNDALRRALTHSITVFLTGIWRVGGLKGAQPEQGFYVRCDETNNPPAVVSAGQVICTIGLAVTDPMEFIEIELRQAADTTDQLAL